MLATCLQVPLPMSVVIHVLSAKIARRHPRVHYMWFGSGRVTQKLMLPYTGSVNCSYYFKARRHAEDYKHRLSQASSTNTNELSSLITKHTWRKERRSNISPRETSKSLSLTLWRNARSTSGPK